MKIITHNDLSPQNRFQAIEKNPNQSLPPIIAFAGTRAEAIAHATKLKKLAISTFKFTKIIHMQQHVLNHIHDEECIYCRRDNGKDI